MGRMLALRLIGQDKIFCANLGLLVSNPLWTSAFVRQRAGEAYCSTLRGPPISRRTTGQIVAVFLKSYGFEVAGPWDSVSKLGNCYPYATEGTKKTPPPPPAVNLEPLAVFPKALARLADLRSQL